MTTETVLSTLDPIAAGLVASHAARIDADGAFPTEAIAALTAAGLMGLVTPVEHGGLGLGIDTAARVIHRLGRECGTTAMVVCMHYCGAAVIAKHGSAELNRDVAAGRNVSTLAFSEAGSRSHFWAPTSTATADGDHVVLDAKKSWITSARNATGYVWSSRPVDGAAPSTIWYVPSHAAGLSIPAPYNGLGLRGNDSAPVTAAGVRIPAANRLGPDGGGFDVMMGIVLPLFSVMNASCALGAAQASLEKSAAHCAGTGYEHLGSTLRDLPTIRAYLARMKTKVDMATTLWEDTLTALTTGRADAMLRVLEVKAVAGETATEVTTTAMRVCGGAAYRKDVGVERHFRDAQAMGVMAPTTDVLYDFIGKAVTGMELFA